MLGTILNLSSMSTFACYGTNAVVGNRERKTQPQLSGSLVFVYTWSPWGRVWVKKVVTNELTAERTFQHAPTLHARAAVAHPVWTLPFLLPHWAQSHQMGKWSFLTGFIFQAELQKQKKAWYHGSLDWMTHGSFTSKDYWRSHAAKPRLHCWLFVGVCGWVQRRFLIGFGDIVAVREPKPKPKHPHPIPIRSSSFSLITCPMEMRCLMR